MTKQKGRKKGTLRKLKFSTLLLGGILSTVGITGCELYNHIGAGISRDVREAVYNVKRVANEVSEAADKVGRQNPLIREVDRNENSVYPATIPGFMLGKETPEEIARAHSNEPLGKLEQTIWRNELRSEKTENVPRGKLFYPEFQYDEKTIKKAETVKGRLAKHGNTINKLYSNLGHVPVLGIIENESKGFNFDSSGRVLRSSNDAYGLMQVKRDAALDVYRDVLNSPDNLLSDEIDGKSFKQVWQIMTNPKKNERELSERLNLLIGAKYFDICLKRNKGDLYRATMAYSGRDQSNVGDYFRNMLGVENVFRTSEQTLNDYQSQMRILGQRSN